MNQDLHWEHAKHALRSTYPGNDAILTCTLCGCSWPEAAEMGMVRAHFQITHETDHVQLNLVWIGEGAAPARPR